MSHILDLQVTEIPAELPIGLLPTSETGPTRMSFRSGRQSSVQTEPRRHIGTPEQQLWAGVLLSLYREIANAGPGCHALREIEEEGIVDLEIVASQLGLPQGFVVRLVEQALVEFQRRKRKKGLHMVVGEVVGEVRS